ncbi:putative transcription factor MYB21-like [Capsicum annuum]|nr:putative transcription factor MYB21-like [Capsicum annuum]KAF3684014.1 putative transcription factor MYB21-like [Capsicum annuum]
MTTDSKVHDAGTTMATTSIAMTSRTNALQAMAPAKKPKKIMGLIVNEAFQVATIVEKLPPMWKDFKKYSKHKHKEMSTEDLIKGKKKDQANAAESKKEVDDLCAMLSECNMVENPCEWQMDFGAYRHVYTNKELFAAFAPAQGEEKIYMANSATAKVEGTGKVCFRNVDTQQCLVCFGLKK